ncbi:hypothetical protein [Streptomyces sp. NPDC006863]|uniref:hypothetical protein n=1 Tax=Streptomyces sp. NPDC006863 TaxID=3154779 RepID=UPI0033ECA3CA
MKARAVNAVGPALQARGEWLRLSTRQAVAVAVLAAVMADIEARAGASDVAGSCPACGAASLFLGEGGHITCARIECPNPCAADDLLHSGEEALAQALGGDRTARIIAYNLHCHGHTLADVRRMTDDEFRAVPGIGDTSLATIRRAFPEQPPGGLMAAQRSAADALVNLSQQMSEALVELLGTWRTATSDRPTHPDGTPYRYHEIVAEGWRYCDGCHSWGQGWTAENPHDCPSIYVKGPTTKEAPDA